jgi:hypothetical protein
MNPWWTTKGSRVRMLRYPAEGERLGTYDLGVGQRVVCTERTTPTVNLSACSGRIVGGFRFEGSRWLRRIRLSV